MNGINIYSTHVPRADGSGGKDGKAAAGIQSLMDNPDAEVPEALLRKATAIAVFSGVIKAA